MDSTWIKVDDDILINLVHVESISFYDREISYARPFQVCFNTTHNEYFQSFKSREDRGSALVKLAKKLKAL